MFPTEPFASAAVERCEWVYDICRDSTYVYILYIYYQCQLFQPMWYYVYIV